MRKALRSGVGGAIIVTTGVLAARGRLPRNPIAGIRIPSTLRSDDAWRAGHRAAARTLIASGMGPTIAALVVAVRRPDRGDETVILRLGTAWLLGWLGVATVQARRAARATFA